MDGRGKLCVFQVLGTIGFASTSALGDGQATWLWNVTTQDGDALVEPGETALVTLSLLMESEMYDMDQLAIGTAVFDTIGGFGADSGEIVDWLVLNNLGALYGKTTTTDGVSLFNTTAAQLDDFQGLWTKDNPAEVFEFEWAPVVEGNYAVEYETLSHTFDMPGIVQVLIAREPDEYVEFEFWPVTEAAISFQVVPAPATISLTALGVLVASGRLRSRGT
jgi:hypothetical protein